MISRFWCPILYTDNESHLKAIELSKKMNNTIIMLHDKCIDPDTGEYKKPHYHIIFEYNDIPKSKESLINELGLNDDDSHLFKTLKEINYKRESDYIIYLTHLLFDDKTHYEPELFEGGQRKKAIQIVRDKINPNDIKFLNLYHFLKPYLDNPDNMFLKIDDYLDIAIKNGYYNTFYKNWNKIKDIINNHNVKY